MYLSVDSDDKWIYANAPDFANALRFITHENASNNAVVIAQIPTNVNYLNWRNTTGAVKLYDSYDNMAFTKWNNTTFKIYSFQQGQYMGVKDITDSSNEMYYRAVVYHSFFEYHYINTAQLTEEENKIWSNYLKLYSDFGAPKKLNAK